MSKKIKPIAIYLPQYHPIPENDLWWGKGFTEWTNVTKAQPLYKGHYQPQLPADLGFYDLRLEETRLAQEAIAKNHGIHGFCYYHYWFNGKLLLNEPIDRKLKNIKEDLPFMLCWANENWTRRWDGMEHEVLISQNYSNEDDINHIKYLIPIFKDSRYIKVNNKAVFVVYKPMLFENPTETVKTWRKIAAENGIELYLCHTVFSHTPGWDKLIDGFDAVIDFEPFGIRRESILKDVTKSNFFNDCKNLSFRITRKIFRTIGLNEELIKYKLNKIEYTYMAKNLKSLKDFPFKIYPNIVPAWDNTARRRKNPALILNNSTPKHFEEWLTQIVNDFEPYSEEESFIFINAWNEWAEGNHLEPCQKWGLEYLEVVKKIVNECNN
jgi:hypothetical protein